MSFFKSLFGRRGGAAPETAPAKEIEHNGFLIRATPYKEGGQWQLCGVVVKEVGGEVKEHRFIRAERFPSLDDAIEMTFVKGRQLVEQSGERVFS